MNTTTINLRIDKKTKQKSQKVLEEIGLDMSSAIKLFLKTVITTQSIPFPLRTVNGFTPEYEAELLRDIDDVMQNGKTYNSTEELFADIDNWDENGDYVQD